MNDHLHKLYDATAEDLLFGIGRLVLPDCRPAPCIQIHYTTWSLEKLDVVRGSFRDGLLLTSQQCPAGAYDLSIATRQWVTLQSERNGHTSLLRGPAWDAVLEGVEREAFGVFERGRRAFGGFLLLMQASCWEFMTGVDESKDTATVGVIVPRTTSVPPIEATDRPP